MIQHHLKKRIPRLYISFGFMLFLASQNLSAQILNKLQIGVDFGLAFPQGKTDVAVGTDIKYNINNQFSTGFRIEGAALAKEIQLEDGSFKTGDQRLNLSYIATLNYYLPKFHQFKPFVEGGLGYYQISEISDNITPNYEVIEFDSEFGIMIKTGFEHEKVRISLGYHILPKSEINTQDIKQSLNTNYLTLSIGYFVGGQSNKS